MRNYATYLRYHIKSNCRLNEYYKSCKTLRASFGVPPREADCAVMTDDR